MTFPCAKNNYFDKHFFKISHKMRGGNSVKVNKINTFLFILFTALFAIRCFAPITNAYDFTYITPLAISYESLASINDNNYILPETYITEYNGITITLEKGVPITALNSLTAYIDITPNNLLLSNPHIYISSRLISEIRSFSKNQSEETLGIAKEITTIGENKNIIIIPSQSLRLDVYFHEMFHCYDNYLGHISEKKEFSQYVNSEGLTASSNVEYFAVIGACYLSSPQMLESVAPNSYKYIASLIENEPT